MRSSGESQSGANLGNALAPRCRREAATSTTFKGFLFFEGSTLWITEGPAESDLPAGGKGGYGGEETRFFAGWRDWAAPY